MTDTDALKASLIRRYELLDRLDKDPEAQAIALELSSKDIAWWFNNFCWTFDPRLAARKLPAYLPFDLFPRQEELVRWLEERVSNSEEGLVEKSRDVGWTWVAAGFALNKWLFSPGFKTTFGSRKEVYVDKIGDPDSIFGKVRLLLERLPPWMRPEGFKRSDHDNFMRLLNPANGNVISGEAGDNMGRGGRSTLYVVDEGAFIEHAESVDAAVTGNADCRIWASSVNGMGNVFYRKRHSGNIPVFRFHWAQPLDAKILTPAGWKPMGELSIGDRVVGSDGKPKNIVGVFPQGSKEVYRVRFNDGVSTECCADHLWSVICGGNHKASRKHIRHVMSLQDMLGDYLIYDKRGYKTHRYQIPLTSPVEFDAKELPVDPYVLGCLLGDGSFPKASSRPIVLTTVDDEMVSLINARLPHPCRLIPSGGIHYRFSVGKASCGGPLGRGWHNPMNKAIRDLGLAGKESHNKSIPDRYRFASASARLELLQGLMDTDGAVCKTNPGIARLSTVSKALADDTVFIAQSLGGVGIVHSRPGGERRMPGGRISSCRENYQVDVRLPDGLIPFRLYRKVAAYKPSSKYQPRRSIVGIQAIGSKECQCIKVDADDGLYLTDNFIVTHNSDDPRKDEAWAAKKRLELASSPSKWEAEYDIDYGASLEGVCIPAKWVQSSLQLAKLLDPQQRGEGVAGMDVGAGSAKSVLIPRFGPVVLMPRSWLEVDNILTTHNALAAAREAGVRRLNYDASGIGNTVTSTLRHANSDGLIVTAVNTGLPPTATIMPDDRRAEDWFLNLKAELWWRLRDQFKAAHEHLLFLQGHEDGVPHPEGDLILLPECPDLVGQVSMPRWFKNEKGKIYIETKKQLAARGVPSPDFADALALTMFDGGPGFCFGAI